MHSTRPKNLHFKDEETEFRGKYCRVHFSGSSRGPGTDFSPRPCFPALLMLLSTLLGGKWAKLKRPDSSPLTTGVTIYTQSHFLSGHPFPRV